MKRYQQLILVILSVLSFISLLFYRHEYNKLRYVLEVFNFFGTPGGSASASLNCAKNDSVEKYLMSEPLPAWQRVSNTLYVYAAYWETLGRKGHVKAPAIGILNENLNYGCYLWYEFNAEPVKGQFSFSGLPRKNAESAKNRGGSKYLTSKAAKSKGFMFYCDASEEKLIPTGVTFYKKSKDETSQAFLPIYKMKPDAPAQNTTAICIMPNEYSSLKKYNYLEFLSFHKSIGIKDFILYGGNYQYNVISPILKNPSYEINLMVMQWNYPFSNDFDLMITVAENDCLLRTNGLFENVIALKWNQFLVPHSHSSLQNILYKLDRGKQISTFQVYSLIFCKEYSDDPESDRSLPFIVRKTRFSVLKFDNPVLIYRSSFKNTSTMKVSKDSLSIHWYTQCDSLDLKIPDKSKKKFDYSVYAFKSEIMQSKLMRLL